VALGIEIAEGTLDWVGTVICCRHGRRAFTELSAAEEEENSSHDVDQPPGNGAP
jgi:hypothetical protein